MNAPKTRPAEAPSIGGPTATALQPVRLRSGAITPEPASLLVVDDNSVTRRLFAEILHRQGYEVACACSTAEAMAWLTQRTFDIILCDIFMPGQKGMGLLNEVAELYPEMAVIVTTGAATVPIAREAVRQGASDFITKPCNQGELGIVVQRGLTRRFLQQKHAQRYKMVLESSRESVLDALLSALHARDTETQGHSERVTAYTMEISDRMALPTGQLYHIERGALLHDIGKIGIPDRILRKPNKLAKDEWTEVRKHPIIGHEMCVKIEMLRPAAQIVMHHHEQWDGSGYPDGLKGGKIPIGARIFAIADTLDAMTSDRPYRAALPFSTARDEIQKSAGKQFDPEIVQIFASVPEERWIYIRAHAAL